MNNFLKYGLIAGGAYLLFKDQLAAMFPSMFGGAVSTTSPQQQAAPAQTTTPAAPAPTGVTPTSAATTKDRLNAWAQANDFFKAQGNMLNAYQWNFGYNAVRGTAAPGPEVMFPAQDPNRLMTLDEYWTGVTSVGLSGVPATARPSAAAKAWGY